jgi:hypothetical protein
MHTSNTEQKIDEILKNYHDKLLMTETEYDIKQRVEAREQIKKLLVEARLDEVKTALKLYANSSGIDAEIILKDLTRRSLKLEQEQKA